MGLNRLFRRLTEYRISGHDNASTRNHGDQEKGKKKLRNHCNFTMGGEEVVSNSSPDILDSCATDKRLNSKKHSSPTADYPSCPALNTTPSCHGGGGNSGPAGIGGCCASSSSSSLLIHQQNQEKTQPFRRGKTASSFLKLQRSLPQPPHQKKRSWLLPYASSPAFLRSNGSHSNGIDSSTAAVAAPVAVLPDHLFIKCLDAIENPFELCRLKCLNSTAYHHIQRRLERVMEMDVRKVKLDTISSNSTASLTSSQSAESSTFMVGHELFYSHPADYKVLMRLVGADGNRVEIIVDDCWTSRDVVLLCNIMDVFRLTLRQIAIDAQVFELVIASLSILDLDRWYAFQCFMKAVNDFQIHLAIAEIPQNPQSENFYWPLAESVTIRTTERDSTHLSRVLDYGVRSQLVMDRRRLNTLKIILTDVDKMNRALIRNLYHFRCWAGSAGFDDRFSQQCCSVGKVA